MQPVYVIDLNLACEMVDVVGAKYTGLQFGDISPEELKSKISELPVNHRNQVHVSAIAKLASDGETCKIPARANYGLMLIVRGVNKYRTIQA